MNKLGRVISGILVVIAVGATLTTCFGRNNNSGSGGTENKKPINSDVTLTSVPAQGGSNDISVTRQDGLKFIFNENRDFEIYIYENYDKHVFAIPVTIENTGDESVAFTHTEITAYGPSGKELDKSYYFEDGRDIYTKLRPETKNETVYCVPYEGAGEYTLVFDFFFEDDQEIKLYLSE